MRIYPVKENPINLAVSEILWYKHTDKETSCYFSIRISPKVSGKNRIFCFAERGVKYPGSKKESIIIIIIRTFIQ